MAVTRECRMSLQFNKTDLIESLANICNVEFLTEESKPTRLIEAIDCSISVLKNIASVMNKIIDDKSLVVLFAKEMGFNEYCDAENDLREVLSETDMPEDVREALSGLMKMISLKKELEKHIN